VPDFYQGTELWSLDLVDPDNRRPVDYARRRELLTQLRETRSRQRRREVLELARSWQDGRIKMFVTDTALDFRREQPALFAEGKYVPLRAAGARQSSVFAYARCTAKNWALAIAPRMTVALANARGSLGAEARWEETSLTLPSSAPARWVNLFTGSAMESRNGQGARKLRLTEALDGFPLALLHAETA
jgi:(1->4)-alpha-D-glucan 1-alpha-D-glucosylmutase